MTELLTLVPTMTVTRIHAKPDSLFSQLREAWTARELLYFLAWRDLRVRYRQTAIGAVWFIVQPLCSMMIFTVVFSRIAHVSSEGLPYPVFVLPALVVWQLFSTVLSQAGSSR